MQNNQGIKHLPIFIKEHRSDEANFEILFKTFKTQAPNMGIDEKAIEEINTTGASYIQAKESRSSAWPEFEKFVAAFEKAALGIQ